MASIFKYILDFKANTEQVTKQVSGLDGMLKGAAVAAGAMFAADKVMEAAAAVFDYAKQISATKVAVETLAGVHGASANAMAGEVTALAQGYDIEVNEAIKGSNVMMKSFGISSKEAFDLLNIGMSGAANANGDLLQQVAEYSPHFKEAGLTATEMFAVIAAGNKEGVFDDKTADLVKEASIRFREMTQSTKDALNGLGLSSAEIQKAIASGSMTTFEAMQKVSAKLKEFPQQAPQVGAALADIFGGPGEDAVNFVRKLGDIDTSMQGLIDSAATSQVRYTETLAEFHAVGAAVFGGTGNLMMQMKTIGMDMVNSLIKGTVSVINYFIDLYNESAVVRGAFEYIGFAVKTVFGEITLIFKNLVNYFKGMGKLWKAIFTGDFKAIGSIIEETFEGAKNNAADFGKKTADNFSNAVENTLNPKEKIKLISLDGEATTAGTTAGKNFAKASAAQMAKMASTLPAAKAVPYKKDDKQSKEMTTMQGFGTNKATGMFDDNSSLANMDAATERVKGIREEFQGMAEDVGVLAPALQSLGESIASTAMQGATSFKEFAGNIRSAAHDAIGAFIAQGVAALVAGALKTAGMTGPVGLALAPIMAAAAGGLAKTAFNTLIPAFANGGIAYGPTMGMIGEYPGARSNPEVIAPLSKLQGMIGDRGNGGTMQVQVVGEISGDTIRLVQKRAERKTNQFN